MKTTINNFKITGVCLLFVFSALQGFSQSQAEIDAHKKRWATPSWTDTIKNPLVHITSSADSGKVIYQRICAVCHGASGKGDGVAAAGLTMKPANHTGEVVQSQTDGSLFYELTNGHAPMPSYKKILTDKQRWQLVCYIRTLKPKAAKK